MNRVILAALVALAAASCGRQPSPAELAVSIVDDGFDMRTCRRLGVVSPPVTTTPGFAGHLETMLQATQAMGGTDLLLDRRSPDWLVVRGVAYNCPLSHPRDWVVVRRLG